jgi:hypothetical protein
MSRVTLTLATVICLAGSQFATAQHSGLGGHGNLWGQPQPGIRALQGGQIKNGHGWPTQGGNGLGGGNRGGWNGGGVDKDDIGNVVGAIILGEIIKNGLKHPHPQPQPWPKPRPTEWPRPYDPGPTITYDDPDYRTPVQRPRPTPRPEPPVQTTPVVNIKPPATDPHKNEIKLAGRPLTAAEIERAKEHFRRRLNELTQTLGCRMPKIDVNMQELMSLLVAQAIAVEIQIRIWDAVRCSNYEAAEELWIVHCPGIKPPFRRSRIWVCFNTFCTRLEAGDCSVRDAQEMEQELIACGLAAHPCCGAPSLLQEIRECLVISQAVSRARPGIQTQSAAVPAGDVDIIYHPGLPEGDTIVLDDQTAMLGTGGVGTMHVQRSNVAQKQGYQLATGESVAEDNTPLVKSGILIENPTQTEVQFVLGNQRFSLEPLGQKTISSSSSLIDFDTGNGGKRLQYQVTAGTSQFVVRDGGWGLQRITSFDAVIDNSANDSPFHYIVQGEHQVVAPHATQSHSSLYPLVIRFDRGQGTDTKQVVSKRQKARLTVGLNPKDNLWDLYDATPQPVTTQPPAMDAVAPQIAPAF